MNSRVPIKVESWLTRPSLELDYVFSVPTKKHMNYQVGTVFPYWCKTQLLRKKGLPEPRLYQFDQYSDNTARTTTMEKSGV